MADGYLAGLHPLRRTTKHHSVRARTNDASWRAPTLAGAAEKYRSNFAQIIRQPTPKMAEGGMMPLEISDEDIAALLAYVSTFK